MTTESQPADELSGALSPDLLWEHTARIARWVRLSGSPEEAEAFGYIRGVLKDLGLETEDHQVEALISLPGEASLQVLAPERFDVRCITHAMAQPTPAGGLEGEVAYTGGDAEGLAGKIALLDGLAMPVKVRRYEEAGAPAQIHINDDQTHEMIVSTIWGPPTPDTVHLLPKTPVISVGKADGLRLKALAAGGGLRVRLKTRVLTEWRNIPLLVGHLHAPRNREDFILFSGHVDSWHYGAMDNAAANAIMLEVARVLAARRDALCRSLRLAFWSGHSHGRYAGSAWYADHRWFDLHDHCLCHVNVDSTGGKGATLFTEAVCMAETRGFTSAILKRLVGQELAGRRVQRAGDQSFWGCGVPSLFMSLSEQPADGSETAQAFALLMGGHSESGGLGWWWHTPEDTLDKLDRDFLLRDARVYAHIIHELCTTPIVPLDYRRTAAEIGSVLDGYQGKAGTAFDLGPARGQAARLAALLEKLYAAIDRIGAEPGGPTADAARRINDSLRRLGRLLIPLNYTRSGPFDQDPATGIPPLPGLEPATRLQAMAGDEARMWRIKLVRERNRAVYYLREAAELIEETLARFS